MLKKLKIEEAIVIDNFQYIHIKAKDEKHSIDIFTQIYITSENKKVYIDKIKSLDLTLIQELYDTRDKFTGKARIVISEEEYRNK